LNERVKNHKKTYTNFRLYAAFKVKNKIEIENCIKKHTLLKNRLRIVTIDDIAHRELIALDENDFTIEKVEQFIKEIIKENEYNVENYNLLLKKNEELQNEIYKLKEELVDKNKLIEKGDKKINKLEYDVTDEIKLKIASNYALCKYGYYLYAYQYEDMRFICSISRQKDFETLHRGLALRGFERRFALSEHMEVKSAEIKNGLLAVVIERIIPEALLPRKIQIKEA
jgi:hypothetical protein